MPDLAPLELDARGTRAYLLGSLHLRGAAHDDVAMRLPRALGWYRDLSIKCGGRGLLLSWVYDLGYLLVEGDTFCFRSLVELSRWPEVEREPRLEYENRLLNWLLRDPGTRQAVESIRQDASRDDLIARTLELLLAPLLDAGGHADAPVVDPVLLRELSVGHLDPVELALEYDAFAERDDALLAAHRSSLETYFGGRKSGPVLGPDDLTEIEHWSAYRRADQRLASRRIGRCAAGFPKIDPGGVTVAEEQEADTELPDSGYYPSGGYSELANRGALENLVPAELIYMGEDPFGDDPDPEIDLFTVRVLENETLYFQRDSGQLRRTRRVVHLAVAPDEGLRFQLKWHQDPLVVMVYGLVVRLSEDLGEIFPGDALTIVLHLVCHNDVARERAAEDRELLRVLLRHEIARGAAEIVLDAPDLDLRTLGERARRVYAIAVQSGERRAAGLPDTPAPRAEEGVREPRVVVWKLGGDDPGPRTEAGHGLVYLPVEGSPEGPLIEARDALLGEIAGVGQRLADRARRAAPRRAGAVLRPGPDPDTFTASRDGQVLVWIPPGTATLGNPKANPQRNQDLPEREATFAEGFYLGRSPVTWGQYRRFCAQTRRPVPADAGPDAHPVTDVSTADALAYCAWAGFRLPSESEWEYAARGADGRPFPWGTETPGAEGVLRANYRHPDGHGADGPTATGSYSSFASPFGCQDMAGNVWEWVSTDDGQGYAVRGGCWDTPAKDLRAWRRSLAQGPSPQIGFRVLKPKAER